MFLRHKFVTNSSNTSFVGFGVWLENEELLTLALHLLKDAKPNKLKKLFWIDDEKFDEWYKGYKEDPREVIDDSSEVESIIGKFIPVSVESPDYGGGAYLHVGMPDVDMDFETGKVEVSGSEKVLEDGRKLQKALKECGLCSKLGVVSDCWRDG